MKIKHEKGVVESISTNLKEAPEGGEITSGGIIEGSYEEQVIQVRVLSGDHKGDVVNVTNDLYGNPFDIEVAEGDKVFLYAQEGSAGPGAGAETNYFIQDYWHSDGLVSWGMIFLILVLVIGGRKGVRAILSLFGSVALIFFVLLPLIVNGAPPVLCAIGISVVIILITHLIITGVGRKSRAAMGGTLGGILFATLMVYAISYFSNLTGMGTEEARMLAVNEPGYDFQAIFFSGVIIGALGAVMDTAISISSGLHEIKEHKKTVTGRELIRSGINIGRDVMGSMLNTLIFAYIGAAMVSVVMFYSLQTNVSELVNYGFIAEEIARSLVGSLGLLMTIPLTALLGGWMMGRG